MQDANPTTHSADLRRMMVDCQIRTFDVTDQTVLAAMLETPRELFVGAANAAIAYSDAPLVLKGAALSRRLLAPMVLARLLQNAEFTPSCRALDVAGAAGYSAAVMAKLAGKVIALESDPEFTAQTRANCAAAGVGNVDPVTGPIRQGSPENSPYDVILVNGVVQEGIEDLLARLAPNGRLLAICCAPGRDGRSAKAVRYDNIAGKFSMRPLFDAAGVTLPEFAARPAFAF